MILGLFTYSFPLALSPSLRDKDPDGQPSGGDRFARLILAGFCFSTRCQRLNHQEER